MNSRINNLFLRLIAGSEYSKIITILDKLHCKGDQLFSCFLQAQSSKACCLLLLENDLDRFKFIESSKFEIIPFFKELKIDNANFDQLEAVLESKAQNLILFIDSLSPLFLTQTLYSASNYILNWSKKCNRLICRVNTNILTDCQLETLREMSQTLIELDFSQTADCLKATLTHKKANHKLSVDVIKVENLFKINQQLNVTICKDKADPVLINDENESMINQLPFNLRLTDDEKKVKDQLVLPHYRLVA